MIELERYELSEPVRYRFELDRREFIRVFGGGLVVLLLVASAEGQESGRRGRRRGEETPDEIGAWLHIDKEGEITVFTGKTEVGQNIRTSLAQAVAEELRVPVSSVTMVMADTDRVPFDRGTFGSRSTPQMGTQLHRVAAAAREAMIEEAARKFELDSKDLKCANGSILDPSDNVLASFGVLARALDGVKTIDDDAPITPPSEWKVAGTSPGKVNGRDFVTGEHEYASDIKRPGMLHGRLLRAPAFNAKLKSVDTTKAEAMSGVSVVHDGDFIGVIAQRSAAAAKALDAIDAEWEIRDQPSNVDLSRLLRGGTAAPENGLKDDTLTRTYEIAYIAHAPLEPRAAVAEWADGKLTVWTGTQRPFGVKGELVEAFRLNDDQVRVIVPDTGSGYGGKHTGEAAIEAARLARSANAPVKVVWTREEEFTWAYFRPAGVIDLTSTMTKDGRLTDWEAHNYNSGRSALETPYDVANRIEEAHRSDSPLRQGSYRGLAASANVFAREVHMDELASIAKLDPLDFRLRNLQEPRLRAVLEAAADRFAWKDRKRTPGVGFGLGCGTDKGSVVAACAEVLIDPKRGGVSVKRVVAAFECGAIVNPDQLRNQVEGAIVMGLGGALNESIQFANGQILNPRFSAYRVPRFTDMSELDVVLLDRKDIPSAGAGETPIVCIAPAVGNAIVDATSGRVDSLPIKVPVI